MFYVRQLILLTLDRYHSSVSCIFELAMFSYWTLMSLRAAVRSGLDTSRSTWTCWAMICSCSSRSSCKEEVQIWLWLVAIIGALIFLLRDFYSFSCILTSSWIFFKKFISSCSASIFLSSWTRFKDASSTSYARNEHTGRWSWIVSHTERLNYLVDDFREQNYLSEAILIIFCILSEPDFILQSKSHKGEKSPK